MKMSKMILAALTAGALAMGSFGTALAESNSASWDVTFTSNKQMVSDYDQQKINAEIDAMMPGDDLTFDIHIENDSANNTDWYMTSTVLRTLEDATEASGGAYTYRLSYDGNELYSSEAVGGDGSQGLHEVDDATGSWLYLATLAPNEGGEVQLYMALDGATQENNYMRRVGGLQINFAVEDSITPNRMIVGGLPQTGDTMMNFVMFGICAVLVALTAMSFVADRSKAKKTALVANASNAATVSRRYSNIRKGGDR